MSSEALARWAGLSERLRHEITALYSWTLSQESLPRGRRQEWRYLRLHAVPEEEEFVPTALLTGFVLIRSCEESTPSLTEWVLCEVYGVAEPTRLYEWRMTEAGKIALHTVTAAESSLARVLASRGKSK